MSYNNYLYSISKEKYAKVKGMSIEELHRFLNPDKEIYLDDLYLGAWEIIDSKLMSLGQAEGIPTANGNSPHCSHFFTTPDMVKRYSTDNEFYVVDERFLLTVIKVYEDKIRHMFSNHLSITGDYRTDHKRMDSMSNRESRDYMRLLYDHLRIMANEWGVGRMKGMLPYELHNEDRANTITSHKYEYSCFELANIYRSFDFENNVLVYAGW